MHRLVLYLQPAHLANYTQVIGYPNQNGSSAGLHTTGGNCRARPVRRTVYTWVGVPLARGTQQFVGVSTMAAKKVSSKATPAVTTAAPAVTTAAQHASAVTKAYLVALGAQHGAANGYCPFTGQGGSSAPFGVLVAIATVAVYLQGLGVYSLTLLKQVAGNLLVATAGQAAGAFKLTPNTAASAPKAVGFWLQAIMQVAHGYNVGPAGVARVSLNGKPTAHPTRLALGAQSGPAYSPTMHTQYPSTKAAQAGTPNALLKHLGKPKGANVAYGKQVQPPAA